MRKKFFFLIVFSMEICKRKTEKSVLVSIMHCTLKVRHCQHCIRLNAIRWFSEVFESIFRQTIYCFNTYISIKSNEWNKDWQHCLVNLFVYFQTGYNIQVLTFNIKSGFRSRFWIILITKILKYAPCLLTKVDWRV